MFLIAFPFAAEGEAELLLPSLGSGQLVGVEVGILIGRLDDLADFKAWAHRLAIFSAESAGKEEDHALD